MALKLGQNKGDVGSALLDCFRLDEAFDAQVGLIGLVAHALHLGDSYVVALAGGGAGISKVTNGAQDDDGGDADSKMLPGDIHSDPEFLGIPRCWEVLGVPPTTLRAAGGGVKRRTSQTKQKGLAASKAAGGQGED